GYVLSTLPVRLFFVCQFRPSRCTAFPTRRSSDLSMWRLANTWFHDGQLNRAARVLDQLADEAARAGDLPVQALALYYAAWVNGQDRKSTRLNSSHVSSSYAVFCLKKKIDRPFQRA